MNTLIKPFMQAVKHWYLPLIVGVLFIALGIYIFFVPLEAYLTLSVLFSVSFIVSGLLDIYFSIENRKSLSGWGWYLVMGLFSLIMGVYLLMYPGISITILPFVVGFTILFRSFQLLGFSFDLKNLHVMSWGNVAISSVLGIILSLILLANPFAAGISLVTITSLLIIFVGISSIFLSLSLKNIKDYPDKISSELKSKLNS